MCARASHSNSRWTLARALRIALTFSFGTAAPTQKSAISDANEAEVSASATVLAHPGSRISTIALGAPHSFHGLARAWMDLTLGGGGGDPSFSPAPSSSRLSAVRAAAAAEEFISSSGGDTLHFGPDSNVFVVHFLFNHWAGLKFSISEAREFVVAYQSPRLQLVRAFVVCCRNLLFFCFCVISCVVCSSYKRLASTDVCESQ